MKRRGKRKRKTTRISMPYTDWKLEEMYNIPRACQKISKKSRAPHTQLFQCVVLDAVKKGRGKPVPRWKVANNTRIPDAQAYQALDALEKEGKIKKGSRSNEYVLEK